MISRYTRMANYKTLNVIGELGGTSLFFISGDALIMELILFASKKEADIIEENSNSNPRFHLFDGSSDSSVGFENFQREPQTLPAIAALERLLDQIRNTGGKTFRILFFNCFDNIFEKLTPDSRKNSFKLLRQCFLMHCLSTPSIESACFDSWYDPNFIQHIREWRPSFFYYPIVN